MVELAVMVTLIAIAGAILSGEVILLKKEVEELQKDREEKK